MLLTVRQLKQMINEAINVSPQLHSNLQRVAASVDEEDYSYFVHVTPLVQNRVLADEVGGGGEGDVFRLDNGHLLKISPVGLNGHDDTKHYIKRIVDDVYSGHAAKDDMAFFGHWIVDVPNDYGESDKYEIVEMADVITLEQWASMTNRSWLGQAGLSMNGI